jgi:hypothetical protein
MAERPQMDPEVAVAAVPCSSCGELTRGKYGICKRTPKCRSAWTMRHRTGEPPLATSTVPCTVCGQPTRGKYGICKRTPDCASAWARRHAKGKFIPASVRVACRICGQLTRSKVSICRKNPACKIAWDSLKRRGELRPIRVPLRCTICDQPTRARFGICSRTLACRTAVENLRYQEDPSRGINITRAYQLRHPEKVLHRQAKNRARARGIPFTLALEDVIIPEFCPVLGIKLEPSQDGYSPNSPTLDRKIPSLGYVPENVWVISYKANVMKSNATPEELRRFSEFFLNFDPEISDD